MKKTQLMAALCAAMTTVPAFAEEASSVSEALSEGEVNLEFRYRYEMVDQDGFDKNANASTLRTRIGYESQSFNGWSLQIEADNVSNIGNDLYNSGVNGNTQYPTVVDPTGTDISKAQLQYHNSNALITLGRQEIIRGNSRFVGNVGWRQNEQAFDGINADYRFNDKLSGQFSYIYNTKRIFGSESEKGELGSNVYLADMHYKPMENMKLTGFYYQMDFDVDDMSNTTAGIDFTHNLGRLNYHLAYANQTDFGDNPDDFSVDYYAADMTYKFKHTALTLGAERLGSDGSNSFQTPLATLHKFQGFADVFLTTPEDGIDDFYIGAATKLDNVKVSATYHDFSAAEGGDDYGRELDLAASMPVSKHVQGTLKFARYFEKGYETDRSKVWLMFEGKF